MFKWGDKLMSTKDDLNTKADFIRQGEKILDFIDIYGAVRIEHLEKFFPDRKKVVNYLIKHQRLHQSLDGVYVSTYPTTRPDKCLIAALGVLADVLDKVESHTKSISPAQISFITHTNDFYEIIYVSYGMETMVNVFFENQIANKRKDGFNSVNVKRIVIIEDIKQMERLYIPQTTRFALVSPNGSLTYFRGS